MSAEQVSGYLGVGTVTVYRWCREGRLPCMKIGKSWRVRRTALEEFLRKSERSETLAGRLRAFVEVPDNLLVVTQNSDLMLRLDVAFFQVAESRGGLLVKFMAQETETEDELRGRFERLGLEVRRLEGEGRLRFVDEGDFEGGRAGALRGLLSEEGGTDAGRPVFASFDFKQGMDVEEALAEQEELGALVEDSWLVVKTSVLEEDLDEWPGAQIRRAQVVHSGVAWLSEAGLSLSRVTAPPPA